VWPHHPLYLEVVPLVEFWRDCGDRTLVVELPDGSHTRIPAAWADDGEESALPPAPKSPTRLSVTAVRELVALLARLRDASK
jgi:hypothetical protein